MLKVVLIVSALVILVLAVLFLIIRNKTIKAIQRSRQNAKKLLSLVESYDLDFNGLVERIWGECVNSENPAKYALNQSFSILPPEASEEEKIAAAALILNFLIVPGRCIPTELVKAIRDQGDINRIKLLSQLLSMANSLIIGLCIGYITYELNDSEFANKLKAELAAQN